MTVSSQTTPDRAADGHVVMRLMFGAWVQQALYAVAKLGVADLLVDGPVPVSEIAAKVGGHEQAMERMLRALCSVGLFDEPEPGRFALNDAAQTLRSDAPDSHRNIAIMHGEQAYAAGTEVLHTALTGRAAFEKVYGMPYFDYLAEHPDARATFDAAMGSRTAVPAVAEGIDLGSAGTIVDVGGGNGVFMTEMLRRHPDARGVIFDLPAAVGEGRMSMARAGLADRVRVVGGDCLIEVPSGGDVYTIVRVLHDFDDDQVLSILRNVRSAMSPGGRLLILDALLPEDNGFNPGRLADLGMLMVLGGRYRTGADLEGLLVRAGFDEIAVRHAPPGSDPRAESLVAARAC
jgi:C-methyltransferase